MKVEMHLEGLEGVLATLQALPRELVSNRGGPVRAALRKGALVILKAEQSALRTVTSNATKRGENLSTDLLSRSLIVSRGKPPPGGNGERYLVRVKKKAYPNRTERGGAHTQQTASLLEYGSSKQPAEPWIRPAFAASAEDAIRTVETEIVRGVDEIVTRLAILNARK